MKRWLVIACALLLGAAAPARAWCEATCLAPASATESHCPTHNPADSTTISATALDECPVLESARPTVPARLDINASPLSTFVPAHVTRPYAALSSARLYSATVFERCTPLRI